MNLRITVAALAVVVAIWTSGADAPRAQARTSAAAAVARPIAIPDGFPAWAYPWDPTFKAPPADNTLHRVPDSAQSFSFVDARNLFLSPDWHPADHPRMPPVVAYGRRPKVRACGVCHRAEGTGGPENANIAGLPEAYIIQQMAEFRSGARRFSGPRRAPVVLMIDVARATSDAEVRQAAAYFSSLKPRRTIRVIEAETIPATFIAGNFHTYRHDGTTEPLGPRIVEVPVDQEQFELRDSRSQFRAYVPPGSLERGAAIVTRPREGTSITCARCHGAGLRGTTQIPGIAGRSPSYLMRQLFDFKHGTRRGANSPQMAATVAALSPGDMLAVAAYLASLAP
ncbi:MAG: cytochrome c [Alphaproteobacteria bacterium]